MQFRMLMIDVKGADLSGSIGDLVKRIFDQFDAEGPPAEPTPPAIPVISPPAAAEPRTIPACPQEARQLRQAKARRTPKAPVSEGRGSKRLVCREKPGRFFTLAEMATLAGVRPTSIYGALSYAKKCGREEGASGGYHFSYADAQPAARPEAAPHETRPRRRGDVQALNTNVVGRSAIVVPQERAPLTA